MNYDIIWFNPDLSCYQAGAINEFKRIRNSSLNYGRFLLVGTVPQGSLRIAERVTENLNTLREPH